MQVGLEVSRYATEWSLPRIPGTDAFIVHTRMALRF